jgi:ribosomal protein S18 acetylase RimI-like enzyme
MPERLRPWRGWDDLIAMQALCSRRLASAPGRAYAHPGDIAWWAGWPPADHAGLAAKCLLWEEADELAGFAMLDPADRAFSILVAPERIDTEHAAAFEDAVTARVARGVDGPIRVLEFEDEHATIERWRRRGFSPIDEGYVNHVRSIDPATDTGPQDDAVVIAPVGDDDVDARASVTYAAFANERPYERYLADYAAFRGTPAYPGGWDLLARDAASGAPVACTIAWADHASGTGTFEPVATHPDAHRRGFGRAVLAEGLRRWAEAGLHTAIVGSELHNEAASALYRSAGFVPDHLLRVYERP